MICFVLLISSAFYPFVIYQLIESMADKFPGSKEKLDGVLDNLKVVLILWQLGFGIVTFIVCILFTHKVAGPMYKLKKYLSDLRDGRIEGELYFRGGDYFQDVADEVNETVGAFQEQFKEDTVYLSEASSYLKNLRQTVPDDKKIVISEIINKLDDIEERFEELIG
jgi:hypothetical protein